MENKGKKIVELFEDLNKHIKSKNGRIYMEIGAIRPDSTNKVACLGCWLADYFETKLDCVMSRGYRDGINALAEHLEVDSMASFLKRNRKLWHNGEYAFTEDGDAYNTDAYPTVDQVTEAWVDFGHKLQQQGE